MKRRLQQLEVAVKMGGGEKVSESAMREYEVGLEEI